MSDTASEPVIVVETPRLRLQRLRLCDADLILGVFNTPEFIKYVGDRGLRTQADAEKGCGCEMARFIVLLRQDSTEPGSDPSYVKIGIAGFFYRPTVDITDLGYSLLPPFYGNGYATEAGEALLEYGKNVLKLPVIHGIVNKDNAASVRVLMKLRFVKAGDVCLYPGGATSEMYTLPNE